MSKYSQKYFLKSFGCALHGIKLVLKSEKNITRQLVVACIALLTAFLLRFNAIEFCVVIICIAGVLTAELFNSAIEYTIDAVFKNKFSKLGGMAKDIAAGAVCLTSVTAGIVGAILYLPKIYVLLKGFGLFRGLGIL